MAAFSVACSSSVSGACRVRSTSASKSSMRRSIAGIVGAILAGGEARAEVRHERIAEDLFDGPRRLFGRGPVSAPGRAPEDDPVRRAVARAAKPRGIDEGLQPSRSGCAIDALPVGREPLAPCARAGATPGAAPAPTAGSESAYWRRGVGGYGWRASAHQPMNRSREPEVPRRRPTRSTPPGGRPAMTRYLRCSPTGCR